MVHEEALYKDYQRRRNAEWAGAQALRAPSRVGSGARFAPSTSPTASGAGGSGGSGGIGGGDGSKDYKMNGDNAYRPEGYNQRDSQLGNDPITAVRTMRNNLRRQAILERENDRPMKAHLCNNAIKELSAKENDLISLNKNKTDALMMGDVEKADRVRAKMNEIKEDAMRNNYADLITDDSQIRAYGVDSKWTRQANPEDDHRSRLVVPPSAAPTRPRSVEEVSAIEKPRSASRVPSGTRRDGSAKPARSSSAGRHGGGRFVPNELPTKERRIRSAARSPEGTVAPPMTMRRQNSAPTRPPSTAYHGSRNTPARAYSGTVRDDYAVKKNERLRDFQSIQADEQRRRRPESALLVDDPYKLPTYYGKCQYCDSIDENFGRKAFLEEHYQNDCKVMNNCRYCHKVVLVAQLTDHYISRCDFLKDKKVRCKRCGLATEREDDEMDIDHPLCRNRMAPSGAQWCPNCAVAVNDNKEAWIKHTHDSKGCYNNPRNSKIGPNAKQSLVPETLFLTNGPRSGSNGPGGPGGPGGAGGAGGNIPPPIYHGPSIDMRGKRLIDADQLLGALRIAQQRKKDQQRRRKQAVDAEDKKADAATSRTDTAD